MSSENKNDLEDSEKPCKLPRNEVRSEVKTFLDSATQTELHIEQEQVSDFTLTPSARPINKPIKCVSPIQNEDLDFDLEIRRALHLFRRPEDYSQPAPAFEHPITRDLMAYCTRNDRTFPRRLTLAHLWSLKLSYPDNTVPDNIALNVEEEISWTESFQAHFATQSEGHLADRLGISRDTQVLFGIRQRIPHVLTVDQQVENAAFFASNKSGLPPHPLYIDIDADTEELLQPGADTPQYNQ
jgi:hypothetical protein